MQKMALIVCVAYEIIEYCHADGETFKSFNKLFRRNYVSRTLIYHHIIY